ncbi:hypothetical protein BU14_0189s0005 [Porphyra umbilicalis]|uniref:Uncharacterized protein n=1 Tax=Porphyra umbilicalis TaxID=2786 RepID=A0A1X6P6F1_PORUM|nr:hypothetical protein BU14_0189s0005 [Porphyra umbilicalis]|eukprot:OSX76471.1 hypothetical protein BU14_0189s0005 [Porphyra umbilicalis]
MPLTGLKRNTDMTAANAQRCLNGHWLFADQFGRESMLWGLHRALSRIKGLRGTMFEVGETKRKIYQVRYGMYVSIVTTVFVTLCEMAGYERFTTGAANVVKSYLKAWAVLLKLVHEHLPQSNQEHCGLQLLEGNDPHRIVAPVFTTARLWDTRTRVLATAGEGAAGHSLTARARAASGGPATGPPRGAPFAAPTPPVPAAPPASLPAAPSAALRVAPSAALAAFPTASLPAALPAALHCALAGAPPAAPPATPRSGAPAAAATVGLPATTAVVMHTMARAVPRAATHGGPSATPVVLATAVATPCVAAAEAAPAAVAVGLAAVNSAAAAAAAADVDVTKDVGASSDRNEFLDGLEEDLDDYE